MFHFFNRFSNELRDVTVFHELLNKQGGRYRLTVGPIIAPDAFPADVGEATQRLKAYIETELAANPERPFR